MHFEWFQKARAFLPNLPTRCIFFLGAWWAHEDRSCPQRIRAVSHKARVPTSFAESVWNFFILLRHWRLNKLPLAAARPIERTVVFMCKPTPSEDEFALWREATGYTVFADARTLEPGVADVSS
jgi:hypothetical protein